jgi:hypothetical protein
MKTKNFLCLIILAFLAAAAAIIANPVNAQESSPSSSIQYPVAELGNCQDEAGCKLYCDKPEHTEACLDFAQKNNLMSQTEIAQAKKFLDSNIKKPGNCQTKDTCESYCNDISHIDECIAFAEQNGIIPQEELAEAKKVQTAIKNGIKPPACGNKKSCDVYCDSPEHMEECITFAQSAGLMSEQEQADAQKMLLAIKKGVKPPPCRGKEACDEYCNKPENMELCMKFAMEAGFMSEQEQADAQKMLLAIKKGVKPPACKGKEACDEYCQQEEHFEECINFAEAAGFMSQEQAAMSRKTKGKGPGGCKSEQECRAFCDNPDNQETCFNFSKENGLIPEEELKKMEEGRQQFKQSLEQAPPEVLNCLTSMVGNGNLEKMRSGSLMPNQDIGDKMRQCFEKMGPPQQGGPGEGGEMAPGQNGPGGGLIPPGQTGPGGCKTPKECQTFCQTNPQECQNFKPMIPPQPTMPNNGGESGGMGMPGFQPKCNSPEECQQIQEQGQQQTPQQPMPCQGDNCSFMPPPNESMPNQPPSSGNYPIPIMPSSESGGVSAMPGPNGELNSPNPNQPQSFPQPQQPMPMMEPQPIIQPLAPQPIMEYTSPPPPSPPPSPTEPAPAPLPPPTESTPPPTSLNKINVLLGFMMPTFKLLTQLFFAAK